MRDCTRVTIHVMWEQPHLVSYFAHFPASVLYNPTAGELDPASGSGEGGLNPMAHGWCHMGVVFFEGNGLRVALKPPNYLKESIILRSTIAFEWRRKIPGGLASRSD